MRIYKLKIDRPINKPHWHFDPPTNRQLKVLSFFGIQVADGLVKGKASGIIGTIFREKGNRELWEKYLYSTGDESDESPDLVAFSLESLKEVVVPDDWAPKRRSSEPSDKTKRMRDMIVEILREGSPFDDPVPTVEFSGKHFAFTGKFSSGSRKDCQDSVKELGAIAQDGIKSSTDYLVIGSEGSSHWAEGSHGRKIEKALIQRMERGKPSILSEADWINAIQSM
jgi:NAD-dependent DNA ligase